MTHSQDPHPGNSNRHDTDANTLPRDQGRVPRGPGGGDERPIEPVGATGGGMGQRGQSGEHRNDACNDPGQHNTGVTGH